MKRYRRASASQVAIIGLIIFAVLAFGILNFFVLKRIEFQDQFVLLWAAGRDWLLGGNSPYGETTSKLAKETLQASNFQSKLPENLAYLEPVTNLVITLPFSLIPYEISRVIWMLLLELSIVLIGFFGFKISGWKTSWIEKVLIISLMILWLPGIDSIIKGTPTPIVILLVLIGIYLIMKGEETPAGFILALTWGFLPVTAIILLFLVIWGISNQKWSMITAYFSGIAFLVAVSLLLLPSWHLDWIRRLITVFESLQWIRTPLMDLAARLPGITNYFSIFLHGALGIYSLVTLIRVLGKKGRIFTWSVLTIIVISYLYQINSSTAALFLIFPAIFLIFRYWSERWGRVGSGLAWAVLIIFTGGSWLNALSDLDLTKALVISGLKMGAPLFTLVGLIWIRWWAVKIPSLPFENK